MYGWSHSALPKRDWKVSTYCDLSSPSSAASSRAVLWQWQWYGSPSSSDRRGTPWNDSNSLSGRPCFIQYSLTHAASARM